MEQSLTSVSIKQARMLEGIELAVRSVSPTRTLLTLTRTMMFSGRSFRNMWSQLRRRWSPLSWFRRLWSSRPPRTRLRRLRRSRPPRTRLGRLRRSRPSRTRLRRLWRSLPPRSWLRRLWRLQLKRPASLADWLMSREVWIDCYSRGSVTRVKLIDLQQLLSDSWWLVWTFIGTELRSWFAYCLTFLNTNYSSYFWLKFTTSNTS